MIHVYRTTIRRRTGSGPVWAVAGPDGRVLVYSIGYPSLQLLQDAHYALSHNVTTSPADTGPQLDPAYHWLN